MVAAADPSHWLYRLTSAEWLAAADTELEHCAQALARRAVRPGVTYARRAAGMALNAVLRGQDDPDARYGRSYMEHVAALGDDEQAPAEVRIAAQSLRTMAPAPPALITLGKPDLRALEAARVVVGHARAQVSENG
ncbi:MAG TPA: hypothetical protein VH374_24765 [Polyangia bacterium]|nr:hypothetical protein [Polyangia bacterium]